MLLRGRRLWYRIGLFLWRLRRLLLLLLLLLVVWRSSVACDVGIVLWVVSRSWRRLLLLLWSLLWLLSVGVLLLLRRAIRILMLSGTVASGCPLPCLIV